MPKIKTIVFVKLGMRCVGIISKNIVISTIERVEEINDTNVGSTQYTMASFFYLLSTRKVVSSLNLSTLK